MFISHTQERTGLKSDSDYDRPLDCCLLSDPSTIGLFFYGFISSLFFMIDAFADLF